MIGFPLVFIRVFRPRPISAISNNTRRHVSHYQQKNLLRWSGRGSHYELNWQLQRSGWHFFFRTQPFQ